MIFPWCHNCHFCALNKRFWVHRKFNVSFVWSFLQRHVTQVVGMMICYAMTGAWESFSKVELLSYSLNCWCISVYRNIMFHQAKLMSKKNRGEKRKHFLCFYSLFSLPSSLSFGEINMAAKTQYWTLNKINVYCSLF